MTSTTFDLRRFIFRMRSYTPIPFLIVMVVFARPTALSLAVGFAILLLGEGLRFWGVSIAGAETRTTGTVGGTFLITNGPFAFVRNPLYLGNMLLYAGSRRDVDGPVPLAPCRGPGLVLSPVFSDRHQGRGISAGRFNGEYERYCGNVRRFMPRLTPYSSATPPPKTVNAAEGFASERRTLQAIGLVTVALFILFLVR